MLGRKAGSGGAVPGVPSPQPWALGLLEGSSNSSGRWPWDPPVPHTSALLGGAQGVWPCPWGMSRSGQGVLGLPGVGQSQQELEPPATATWRRMAPLDTPACSYLWGLIREALPDRPTACRSLVSWGTGSRDISVDPAGPGCLVLAGGALSSEVEDFPSGPQGELCELRRGWPSACPTGRVRPN